MQKYKIQFNGIGNVVSTCYVEIENIKGKTVVVIIPDINNKGTSVTNYFEKLAKRIFDRLPVLTNLKEIIWINHTYSDKNGNYTNCIFELVNNMFELSSDNAILDEKIVKEIDEYVSNINLNNTNFQPLTL